jgi:tetratricopeptide (TPR) repeat protein
MVIEKKVENYSKGKIHSALQKCMKANNCVLKAGKEEKNSELLIQAIDLYQESIQIYSRIPEPYIGIAYISYIAGEITEAIGFTHLALSIDPKNAKALQMLNYYQDKLNRKNKLPAIEPDKNK